MTLSLFRRWNDQRWLLLAALAIATTAAGGSAQDKRERTCFRGQRQPACDRYRVFEIGIHEPVIVTSVRHEYERRRMIDTYASAQVGFMRNTGSTAQGAVLMLGGSQIGPRFGAQLRQRWWIGRAGTVDLSLGVQQAQIEALSGPRAGFGGVADIAVGFGDYGQLVVRQDLLRTDVGNASAVSTGLRLGSYPAVIAAGAGSLLLLLFAASLSTGNAY